jgi:hypothetical protein
VSVVPGVGRAYDDLAERGHAEVDGVDRRLALVSACSQRPSPPVKVPLCGPGDECAWLDVIEDFVPLFAG